LRLNNSTVPVYKGQSQAMVVTKDTTDRYRGGKGSHDGASIRSDGLLDVEENNFSVDENEIQKENGISAMVRLINQNPHMVDLIG